MRKPDNDCRLLAQIQAEIFEESVEKANCGSELFVKRFMFSKVASEFDSVAFLDGTATKDDAFDSIEKEYGKSDYGSKKYNREVMYWVGYLYRYLCYCYEITSYQAYKFLPLKYVASAYESYHTLDILATIERLQESKGIDLTPEGFYKRAYKIYKERYHSQRPKGLHKA